jgi:phosphatidylglycerophosphate synthase
MLDAVLRPYIDPPLNAIGRHLAAKGVRPNAVTLTGFSFGLAAIYFISQEHYLTGLIWLLLNRLFDGIDGAVARATELSDIGGFLDIVCDFIIYAGVIFGFALAQPENSLWAAFLIFSYIAPISTFLAYAILAEKHKKRTQHQGIKSIYYLEGLCEGSETILVMVLLCLKPDWLISICIIYGTMCWMTSLGRTYSAYQDFAP